MFSKNLVFLVFLKFSFSFPNSIDVDILKYAIPCPLEWVEHHIRSPQLPSSAISYFNGSNPKSIIGHGIPATEKKIIVRTKIFGQWILGSYEAGTLDAEFYSPKSSQERRTLKQKKFLLLTNPNNCYIDWVFVTRSTSKSAQVLPSSNSGFRLSDGSVSFDDNNLVGRVITTTTSISNKQKEWELCSLHTKKHKCLALPSNKAADRDNFQMLQSLTPRLSFQINNISLTEIVDALEVTFQGTDKILNKAPVDVSSTVTYGVTKSKGELTEKSRTITTGGKLMFMARTSGSSTDLDRTENLDISRDISVPPMTSVESCSTQVVPKLVINYVIDVTFFATGVDIETLETILRLEKFNGPFESDDGVSIKTQIQGELKDIGGEVSTNFYVNPSDVMDFRACSTTHKKLNAESRQNIQKRLNREGVINIQKLEELRNIIVRNIAKTVAPRLK